MSRAADYRSRVKRVIDRASDNAKFTFRKSSVSVDPVTGLPTDTVIEETSSGVFIGIDSEIRVELELKFEDRILRVPYGELSFVPDSETRVIVGDDTYRVVKIMPMEPGTDRIYTDIIVRGGHDTS